jgi:hypothetical protein
VSTITTIRSHAPTNSTPALLFLHLAAVLFIYLALVVLDQRLLHWFAIPVIGCGILLGPDIVKWLQRRVDIFDLRAIIAVVGFHYFFLAPLLLIFWDAGAGPPFVDVFVQDNRPYAGIVASLHFVGIALFFVVESFVSKRPPPATLKLVQPRPGMASLVLFLFLLLGLGGQLVWLYKMGGLSLRIAYDDRDMRMGQGAYRLLAFSVPIVATMWATVLRHNKRKWVSRVVVTALLLLAIAWCFLFFGLAGSRISTIWPVMWILMILHYLWRPFTMKSLVIGFICFLCFSTLYTFYKWGGLDEFSRVINQRDTTAISERAQQTLVGDLSRTYVHVYQAYVLQENPYPYRLRMGRTVIGDVLVQFPQWIYRNEFNVWGYSGKMKAGTDMVNGPGYMDPTEKYTISRFQYGLSGYIMMNFGLLAIPLGFGVWGGMVGYYRRWQARLMPGDSRWMIVPAFTIMLAFMLMYDLDNLITSFIFRIAFPLIALVLATRRVRYQVGGQGA